MESRFLHAADRYLVWLVAVLAGGEAAGAAIQGFLDGRPDHVLLWTVLGTGMISAAILLESLKIRRDG